jgi:hypothetical protein
MEPLGQAYSVITHLLAPATGDVYPPAHNLQEVAPKRSLKLPTGQGVHLGLYVPAAKVPAGHLVQEVDLAGDEDPGGHPLQLDDPAGANSPAAHAEVGAGAAGLGEGAEANLIWSNLAGGAAGLRGGGALLARDLPVSSSKSSESSDDASSIAAG